MGRISLRIFWLGVSSYLIIMPRMKTPPTLEPALRGQESIHHWPFNKNPFPRMSVTMANLIIGHSVPAVDGKVYMLEIQGYN